MEPAAGRGYPRVAGPLKPDLITFVWRIHGNKRPHKVTHCPRLDAGGWMSKVDSASGRTYYVNAATKESRWHPPASMQATKSRASPHPTLGSCPRSGSIDLIRNYPESYRCPSNPGLRSRGGHRRSADITADTFEDVFSASTGRGLCP